MGPASKAPNPTWEAWWPDLYRGVIAPVEYPGGSESYKLAGMFLAGDALVEEWGCATTFGRQFIPAPYRGVDGGPSEFVDVVADLREYGSGVPNALIRHVLEHNWDWRDILDNFVSSFTKKAAIILFIPMGVHDINRSFEHRVGKAPTPPGLQLDEASFFDRINRPGVVIVDDMELANDTPPFGYERVIFLEKKRDFIPISAVRPRCAYCGEVGYEQMRVDLTLLGQRYEMAVNACAPCLAQAQEGLYSLKTIPEVSWKDN